MKNSINVNVIRLDEIITECALCGVGCTTEFNVAMFEGKVVDPDTHGDWAGYPVCQSCYQKWLTEQSQ